MGEDIQNMCGSGAQERPSRGSLTGDATPSRVQLRRTKGWRIPPNTVKVDRSSQWGNPWKVGGEVRNAAVAVHIFRSALKNNNLPRFTCEDVRRELAGKNLACWCRLGDWCHADVLLELANAPEGCAVKPEADGEASKPKARATEPKSISPTDCQTSGGEA